MRIGPNYNRGAWWTGIVFMVVGLPLLPFLLRAADFVRIGACVMYFAGVTLCLVASSRSRRKVRARLAERNFSWCAACGYPFSEAAGDHEVITCAECGAQLRADKARAWYRENPDRAQQIAEL